MLSVSHHIQPLQSMRTFLYVIAAFAPLFTACMVSGAEKTNTALSFYVVSEEKLAGGRFIDSAAMPKVGYIGWAADLVVTNLLDVHPQQSTPFWSTTDTNGNRMVVQAGPRPALAIVLSPEEAKRLRALTERAAGKKLLVVVGDKPLAAPRIMAPIEDGSIVIEFGQAFGGQAEADRVERDLKRLIKHKQG